MFSNGEPLDLYKLFMVVKEKGGFDAVCKDKLWDLVGEEYGLGVKVGSSIEVVYSKYLSNLETCLKNVADSKFPECGLVDDRVNFCKKLMELQAESMLDNYSEEGGGNEIKRVCDFLDGRKLCGTNRVRGINPELNVAKKVQNVGVVDLSVQGHSIGNFCSHNYAMDIMDHLNENETSAMDIMDHLNENETSAMDIMDHLNENETSTMVISDAVNSMPELSDGGKSCDNGNDDGVVVLDSCSVDKESSGRKRKRESLSEMLSWVTGIAMDPCDPAVGSMPEKSKWKSYSSEVIWKQVLLFRESLLLKRGSECEQSIWQGQKMHPCMYDDPREPNYHFRERLNCDKKLLLGKSTSGDASANSSEGKQRDLEITDLVPIPLGPSHQAEVAEWTGKNVESDSKWLGRVIWPSENVNSGCMEGDPIGVGRKDSCGCQEKGSVECIRLHIAEERSKIKSELGVAFYLWNLHKVGEDVSRLWTEAEERRFKDVVKSNPLTLETCFWDELFTSFPRKSREDLVSYYFNVFLLRRRGYQNRNTPNDIDSDDDESEYGPLKNVFGNQAHNSRSFALLSPKKPPTKGP